jgi:hypothetical protein
MRSSSPFRSSARAFQRGADYVKWLVERPARPKGCFWTAKLFFISKCQPFHSANASNAASGSSPAYNLLANARRRSRRVRSRGKEDSMIARAVSNIEEAILMRRSGVMSL